MKHTCPATKPTTWGVYADRKNITTTMTQSAVLSKPTSPSSAADNANPTAVPAAASSALRPVAKAFERSTDIVPSTTQNPWSSRSSPAMRIASPTAIPARRLS